MWREGVRRIMNCELDEAIYLFLVCSPADAANRNHAYKLPAEQLRVRWGGCAKKKNILFLVGSRFH